MTSILGWVSSTRRAAVSAALILAFAFAIDAATPQELSDAVCYCIAVALAAWTKSRRLTLTLIIAALVLNVPPAVIDAAVDGFHWDTIGVVNRFLSIFVILIVGGLTLALQVRKDTPELVRELSTRNRELEERHATIGELVNAISHDLRMPLAALSVTMEHAANGAYGAMPAEYLAALRSSRVLIDDLRQLAETLLFVARFEALGLDPHLEPVALGPAIEALVVEYRTSAHARGVTLIIDACENATVLAAHGDLRRAIANLLANALAYTPRGGRVNVSLLCRKGHADLIVADNGFGVEPALRYRIFERGSRGPRVATGLGLYIVRQVAEAAGGSVHYVPRVRGSIYRLSFPALGEG
jgi:two-component system OmpR family sensor kinase